LISPESSPSLASIAIAILALILGQSERKKLTVFLDNKRAPLFSQRPFEAILHPAILSSRSFFFFREPFYFLFAKALTSTSLNSDE
jgi:hypothetical protein